MTDSPPSIGAKLKAERERKGLSSQKAADELHLDGWVIDALEADDYERIGPAVYAKGHLKRYASLLGLSAVDVMSGYESRVQAPKPPAAQPAVVRLHADAPPVSNLPWAQVAGAAAIALLVAGMWWWKPWHRHDSVAAQVEPAASMASPAAAQAGTDTTPTALAAAPPAASAAPPPATVAATTPPAAADSDTVAGTGRARLRLSFSADSWVDVHDAAGRRVFAGNGRANSVKTIAGSAPMRVYLGFASGVQLEIDNHAVAIGPQFLAGDVARFEAGADGVLRRDTHSTAAPAVQSRNLRPTG